jgi:hypothetical protein
MIIDGLRPGSDSLDLVMMRALLLRRRDEAR